MTDRRPNLPGTANHTLPVHAIQFSGDDITTAHTFLEFHPCSNYGGQNFLSASGRSCSSQATGELSGITGLVYSAGIRYVAASGMASSRSCSGISALDLRFRSRSVFRSPH